MEDVQIHQEVLDKVEGDLAIAVVTATKPDFYKQWSLIPACQSLDVPVIVINTGQHYDDLLGFGLEEFKIHKHVAFDLKIRGNLLEKGYQLVAKAGYVARHLQKELPNTKFLPIVHGDTLAAGMFPTGWMLGSGQKVGHNEAGLRGMSPELKLEDPEEFVEKQWYGEWSLARQEPFPEQWDTFVGSAGSELHFAPREINAENLTREGYPEDRIFTVGNSIVDAMEFTKNMRPEESVFDIYPGLEKFDNWIRADIHRRSNLAPSRFKEFYRGITSLVKEGQPIVWVELTGTKFALEEYGLRDKLTRLDQNYDNFLFTPLWRSYAHVMEFLRSGRCLAELTDSGSMQEELNQLKIPTFTVRYNTDRPETVYKARSNILVPPHEGLVDKMVRFFLKRDDLLEEMSHAKRLYGKDVGIKIVQRIKELSEGGLDLMRTVPGARGLAEQENIDFL